MVLHFDQNDMITYYVCLLKSGRYMKKLILFYLALCSGSCLAAQDKTVYGYVEKITIDQKTLVLSAKLDTGAKTASINATHITEIMKDNKPFVQFTVSDKKGHKADFELPQIGTVSIKTRSGEMKSGAVLQKHVKRPLVLMRIKLGNKVRNIEVNLTNRARFIYPMLLGREAIKEFDGLVDPSRKYTIQVSTG